MKFSLFLRSVWHTPPRQLLVRLALVLKRHTLTAFALLWPNISKPSQAKIPELQLELPRPLWAPPLVPAVIRTPSGWCFNFLNAEMQFSQQVEWHSADINSGTRLWKLNLHYFDWCDAIPDDQFCILIDDWIANNRPYGPGYWLDSWNSYAISIRVVAWMGEIARRQDRIGAHFCARVVASIAEQLNFLIANLELDIGGNHVIKNIKALYWGSQFFCGADARHAADLASKLLDRELNIQVLKDGFHFELSPSYHVQVLADLLDCWRLMGSGTLRDRLHAALVLMAQVVADMTHPDGAISLFNDGGLRMSISPSTLLSRCESLLGTCPSAQNVAIYPVAGYFVFRQEDLALFYDAGSVGPDGLPAHSHGDIFAFELSLGSQRIFVDCGVYEYNSGIRRSRSRSTVAHNTLTLNDLDQCEFWSSFRMGRRANVHMHNVTHSANSLIVDAEHDGYTYLPGQPVHRRRVACQAGGAITVFDTITGGAGQHATARLLLHPSIKIVFLSDNLIIVESYSNRVFLTINQGRLSVKTAVWWPDFGVEEATHQVLIDYGQVPGAWSFELKSYATES
jgi:uncharacterized heparinase superfamily protein